MPAMTRGPLPPRVYWVRRVMILGTALLLVFGIARLLVGGSDASSGEEAAAPVAAGTTPSVTSVTGPTPGPTAGPTPTGKAKGKHHTKSADPTPTPLAAPEGDCDATDVAVTPKVSHAVAGRDVLVVLQLRTLESEACTFRTGHDELTVSITSGNDDIWSSRQCPRAIPVRDVTVRKAVTTNLGVTWKARRSDDTCSRLTAWAMPGWYHVTASSVGGEPSDVQFELTTPTAATVTKTAKPTQSPAETPSGRPVTR
ncbi:MAG: hypothetical protein KDB43_16995 [Nocardioidaceae bacterium]|nr:hypothetical protein [Nocardioidaceae bacterium]